MKAFYVVLLSILACGGTAIAQPGRIGLGLRGSIDGGGISGKYFLDRGFALEGQLNFGGIRAFEGRSMYGCALIEYHLQLPFPAYRVFFGGGLHAGEWWDRPSETPYEDEFVAGLDGTSGIEYIFNKVPLSISGDVRISLNYLRQVEFMPHNLVGFSLRYYLGSNKAKPFVYPLRIRRKFN